MAPDGSGGSSGEGAGEFYEVYVLMTKLYHYTWTRHIPRILEMGLIPGHRVGLTWMIANRPKWKCLFLTDNPPHILETQIAYTNWDKVTCLEVDVESMEVMPRFTDCFEVNRQIPHEYVYYGRIPKERIKVTYDY